MRFAELSVIITLLLLVTAAEVPAARQFVYSAIALQVIAVALAFLAQRTMARQIEHLTVLSEHDSATGCLNRRGFARVLEELAERGGEVAMLALDLDYFKRINDRYGHNIGDVVLAEVSRVLIETTGSDGHVARLGGEEFGILLPDADAEAAGVMAERLVARLRGLELAVLRHGETVTMSVGVATERLRSSRDCAALRARADEALYIAKRGGRDRALLWAPGVRSFATPVASSAVIVTLADGIARDNSTGFIDRRGGLADRRAHPRDEIAGNGQMTKSFRPQGMDA